MYGLMPELASTKPASLHEKAAGLGMSHSRLHTTAEVEAHGIQTVKGLGSIGVSAGVGACRLGLLLL